MILSHLFLYKIYFYPRLGKDKGIISFAFAPSTSFKCIKQVHIGV